MSYSTQKSMFPRLQLFASPKVAEREAIGACRAAEEPRTCAIGRLIVQAGQLPAPEFSRPVVARILIAALAQAAA